MSEQFPSRYDITTEQQIYELREKQDLFHPETVQAYQQKKGLSKEEKFMIALPPPNVTGQLHLGHSMMLAVEDAMIRHARMQGKDTLWVPGTDHASISTQVVVEKKVAKEENKSRHDLGREVFLGRVWDWTRDCRSTIINQTKRMGSSLDRKREQFTMSEKLSRAVRKSFALFHSQGKIYNDTYITNRCPRCQTVLSDLEVVYKEQQNTLHYIKYFIADSEGNATDKFLTVATVRPETMFGDVALAVHPEDERFKQYIGQQVIIPIINKTIPVVADTHVDIEFGTGALKITPCHDPADFEIGQKHKLPLDHFAIDKEGKITERGGEFVGMDTETAFPAVVQKLKDLDLLTKTEDYTNNVPKCDRCATRIEPMVSQQWFMNVDPAAKRSVQAVQQKDTKIHPERFNKIFFNRMDNIRPRCISRQLRWGHRIPVWNCSSCGDKHVFDEDVFLETHNPKNKKSILTAMIFNLIADSRLTNPFSLQELVSLLDEETLTKHEGKVREAYCSMYSYKHEDDATKKQELEELKTILSAGDNSAIKAVLESSAAISQTGDNYELHFSCPSCQKDSLEQDPDVLDTRYSSGLRPFSILGRPEKTPDLKTYYPNNVLETGGDIIFFRVARMMFMGLEVMNEKPFDHVYLHGLIRDAKGQKMSKSKGNGIDPLDVIEKYGADALRLGLLVGSTPGNDIKFSEDRVEYFRRFLNKLRNATRFVWMNTKNETDNKITYEDLRQEIENKQEKCNDFDRRMLQKINRVIKESETAMEKFTLGEFAQDAIDTVRHDFCDRYIEITKHYQSDMTNIVLMYSIGTLLKLLHPFIPFVTEKIWQTVPFDGFIIAEAYPTTLEFKNSNPTTETFMDIISAYRNLRAEVDCKPNETCDITFEGTEEVAEFMKQYETLLNKLIRAESISYTKDSGDDFTVKIIHGCTLGLKANQQIDRKAKLASLEKELETKQRFVIGMEKQLSNEAFTSKAPAHVIEERKISLQEAKETIATLEAEIVKVKAKV